MSLSRLLGGNKRVNIEVDRKKYQPGDRVQVFARVLTSSYDPAVVGSYSLTLQRQAADGQSAPLKLEAVPDSPGSYQGFIVPREEGRYQLTAAPEDQQAGNTVDFDVEKPLSPEAREPRMQEQSLRKMAEISGGKSLSIRNIDELPRLIGRRSSSRSSRANTSFGTCR